MNNTTAILADNIQKYRKMCSLTQEALAEKIGVTFQAVSKWENAKSAPDIAFLPMLADLFGCSIDKLFSRGTKKDAHYNNIDSVDLPWPDDDIIRGVVYKGRERLQITGIVEKFTFEVVGDAKCVKSSCNINVNGNVSGGCRAGHTLTVDGSVSGGCSAGHTVAAYSDISGGCRAGHSLTVKGSVSGGCSAGMEMVCGGNVTGDISVGNSGEITIRGDVKAKKVKGNVLCNSLECDKIEGNVTIQKKN